MHTQMHGCNKQKKGCFARDLSRQGRARIPFEAGKVGIHAVSALSIKKIEIEESEKKPIAIKTTMSNSASIFQIDELLKKRIENSKSSRMRASCVFGNFKS